MKFLTCSQWNVIIFFVFSGLRFLASSPIPSLQDYLNRKSRALPAGDKGQISQYRLLDKQHTLKPPSALDNLAYLSEHQADFNKLKSKSTQQLRAPRDSPEGRPSLKSPPSQENSNRLTSTSSTKQSWKNLPLKPEQPIETPSQKENISPLPAVPSPDSNQVTNSVLSSQTQSIKQGDLPLGPGTNVINFGRIDLKTDWCRKYHFKETVKHHGCKPVSVDNNMCYGQCNSFYIPKHFVSCSHCAASKVETIKVRLECPGQNPNFVEKKVSIVKECECKDCELVKP